MALIALVAQTQCFAKIMRIFAHILIMLILLILLMCAHGRPIVRWPGRTAVICVVQSYVRSYGRVQSYGRMVVQS